MVNTIKWVCKPFKKLSVEELYAILQLRAEIFVVEQHCIFQDMDGKDLESHHLLGFNGNTLVAYTRLLPPGISYTEASIGRVVVKIGARNNGMGKKLMKESIERCYNLFGRQPVKIGGQLYLKTFYESLGFEQCSEVYDEDGIRHIKMIKHL